MPLNRRLTLLVALIFGGLLLFSLFLQAVQRDQVISLGGTQAARFTPGTPQSGVMFSGVEPSAIVKIVIRDSTSGHTLTLAKVPGDWQARDEKGNPATFDLANLSRVIQILGTLRYNRVLVDKNVAAYGLAGDAKVTIQFETGTFNHRLRIGDVVQVSSEFTYVQRDDDGSIYLVPTQTLNVLSGLLAGSPP